MSNNIDWYEAVQMVEDHVVRLTTPSGQGTGFLFYVGENNVGIATAAHVLQQADQWEQLIKVEHAKSQKSVISRTNERAIFLNNENDTAVLLFPKGGEIPFPSAPLRLAPDGKFLRVGNDVGWLGFPGVTNQMCFFHGRVSAVQEAAHSYLVDGVSIHGVSGGPAFHIAGQSVVIMGAVSAYMPNRLTGELLPGLAVVQDVSHFNKLAKAFQTLEQARKKAAEGEASSPSVPSAPSPLPPLPSSEG